MTASRATTPTTSAPLSVSAVLITRDSEYPRDVTLNAAFAETIVETHCPHVFRRFERAAEAKHDIVYVQDDDCIIDILRLSRHYNGLITHAITHGHRLIYRGTGVTLIGWGAFFPRSFAVAFLDQQRYWREKFGDEVFEMEADRMFTFQHQPHNTVVMPITELARRVRMSHRPDHYQTRDSIFKTLRSL